MEKNASIEILETLEIDVSETGFTIWIIENGRRHWIVDGSCIKEDGEIRYSNSGRWNTFAAHTKGKLVIKQKQ